VRLVLKVVMQNYGDFMDIILLLRAGKRICEVWLELMLSSLVTPQACC